MGHDALRLLERLPLVTYTLRRERGAPPVYVSPQMETTFGAQFRDDRELWRDHVHPDDRASYLAAHEALYATGEPMEAEYRVFGQNGEAMWVRDAAAADGELIHGYLVDITREKRLEEELAGERATLDAFFRASAIGLAITDAEGRYVRINDSLAQLNGAPPDAHLGKTLADVSPQMASVVDPLRESTRERAAGFDVEVEKANGEPFHAHLSYFPFSVAGEHFHGRVVVDLSEQRRAEAAERMYRRLVEQLPLVAYVNELAPTRRAAYVSPRIEEVTGYAPEAFLTNPELGDAMIHPDDMRAILEREELSRREGRVFEHEYRIVRADGEMRWVMDRMETVYDEDGAPLYEQGFLVDITESRETASLLRAVWDGSLDGMLITDDEGRYLDANPAAVELFGRTREELLALRIGEVSETPQSVWNAFLETKTARTETALTRPDGVRREIDASARADVLPGRHLLVLRDQTRQKQLQRDLWRAQKLESVARLAGGVAHDFNNLLTAIRGYALLLARSLPDGSVEGHHAREIDRAADRAAALTAQLLALGRRQTLQERPLDLNRHLDATFDALVELAGPRHELLFELEPALRAVRVDAPLLSQAVLNLVGNAVDAMEDGGTIVIRTANADVAGGRDELADGAYVVLSVSDTGRGLDEATIEHVFEPFFTTKEWGAGSGLGLASAYGTVKQSGGTITVESTPGVGSTFSIWLPEAGAADVAPARRGEGETVLVVERDPAVRDVLFELLTDAGYRVLTAPTGVDALRLADRVDRRIDLVLSDLEPARFERLAAPALALEKPYTAERLQRGVSEALASPERVRQVTVSG